jgi:hypothetical protein
MTLPSLLLPVQRITAKENFGLEEFDQLKTPMTSVVTVLSMLLVFWWLCLASSELLCSEGNRSAPKRDWCP